MNVIVFMIKSIPLEQGLRPINSNTFMIIKFGIKSIPLEQGLRHLLSFEIVVEDID